MPSIDRDAVSEGFERDKRAYWAMREQLLSRHGGRWVAVHRGVVVAVGDDPLSIMDQALAQDGYAYTNKVGEEEKVIIRQRRVSFDYDTRYAPTPIPRVTATFHNFPMTRKKTVTDAIPDIGADVSCLPVSDSEELDLVLFPYYSGISRPFGGHERTVTFYAARVEIDERVYNAVVEPVSEPERLIGRDVLNNVRVIFDGPRRLTTLE